MVGIVIVSHSEKLAQGVVELCALMTPDVPMAPAGGLEEAGFGTSFEKISAAADRVCSDDGAVVLMDMGSAVMTAEMVLEAMPDRALRMVDCPLVEGAVAAALSSAIGQNIEQVIAAAQGAVNVKKMG